MLNGVSDKQPIFLLNSSMHVGYVNDVAMERVKDFFKNSSKTDVSFLDTCNGILQELPQLGPVLKVIAAQNSLSADDLHLKVQEIFAEASSRGVTSVLDAGVDPATVDKENEGPSFLYNQPEMLKRIAESNCPVRISGALAATTLADFNDKIEGRYHLNTGNELFNIPFIKILSDGSNQGLTGLQFQPYECNENYLPYNKVGQPQSDQDVSKQTNIGLFNYGYPTEYDTLIKKIVDNGWPMMIHANGDQAASRTVEALERAGLTKATKEQRRDRIEHASLLTNDTLEKMQELGTSPSFLIGHVGYWGWAFQQTILGTEKSQLLDRCQSAISQHDMRITLHSDYSVTPLGPLRMMEQAITRIMEGAPGMPRPKNDSMQTKDESPAASLPFPVLNEEEQISRFQALKAATYDAAWQCHAETWSGSLEVGKCADFVILEASPLTYGNSKYGVYSAFGMRDIKVLETWKGGVRRYHNKDV
ncbi:amidohydrolase [Marinomonas algicola]|uniref:amidohydrolase n=1 Tax=Marinomonas algicola TaxID=2773454 RepID=UPI0019D69D46|nr:amidohydrolase family protein [Marinomonas algicola]